ncbi:MAG: restriction endonuclease [Clostridia bacterium]|nr:restriction endonuclease [Clostridia bacterium]
MEEVKETKEKKVRKPRAKKEVAEKNEAKSVEVEEVAATVAVAQTPQHADEEKKQPTKRRTRVKKTEEQAEEKTEEKKTGKTVEKKPPVKRTRVKKVAEKAAEKAAEGVEEKPTEKSAEEQPTKKPQEKAEEKKTEPVKKEKEKVLTRAERIDSLKALVRETLSTERKWSELLDDVVKAYLEKNPTEKGGNVNDVNGRVGSIIGQMKKDGEVIVEGGVAKLSVGKEVAQKSEEKAAEPAAEKTEKKVEEKPEAKKEEKKVEKQEEKKEDAPVYDLSSFFSQRKPAKTEPKEPALKTVERVLEEKTEELEKAAVSQPPKAAVKAKTEEKKPAPALKATEQKRTRTRSVEPTRSRDLLKEAFLKKLRSLGGDYFEYYSVYLLEKYSRRNGRRLEGLRVSGGDHDGGIDGEIEVSDRLGFRETLYVQAKNWEPTDEKWMVGETLLQQFIGAVAYRKAKEGKQHARGVFMTTSRFTPEAKEMLEKMSDQFVGFDGDELYEAAKECSFGLKEENGVWKMDERLLSGEKAFFNML